MLLGITKFNIHNILSADSIAKHHPPCMRLVVRETNVNKLKVGSLFVITKDGGSIGREGDQHAIVIKDNNVSRVSRILYLKSIGIRAKITSTRLLVIGCMDSLVPLTNCIGQV